MFIDQKSIEISYVDEADEYLAKLLEVVGQPVLEAEPPQLEHDEKEGQKYGTEPESEEETIDIIYGIGG